MNLLFFGFFRCQRILLDLQQRHQLLELDIRVRLGHHLQRLVVLLKRFILLLGGFQITCSRRRDKLCCSQTLSQLSGFLLLLLICLLHFSKPLLCCLLFSSDRCFQLSIRCLELLVVLSSLICFCFGCFDLCLCYLHGSLGFLSRASYLIKLCCHFGQLLLLLCKLQVGLRKPISCSIGVLLHCLRLRRECFDSPLCPI